MSAEFIFNHTQELVVILHLVAPSATIQQLFGWLIWQLQEVVTIMCIFFLSRAKYWGGWTMGADNIIQIFHPEAV